MDGRVMKSFFQKQMKNSWLVGLGQNTYLQEQGLQFFITWNQGYVLLTSCVHTLFQQNMVF